MYPAGDKKEKSAADESRIWSLGEKVSYIPVLRKKVKNYWTWGICQGRDNSLMIHFH